MKVEGTAGSTGTKEGVEGMEIKSGVEGVGIITIATLHFHSQYNYYILEEDQDVLFDFFVLKSPKGGELAEGGELIEGGELLEG